MEIIFTKRMVKAFLIAMSLVILSGLILINLKEDEDVYLLAAPIKGDMYEIKKDDHEYTVYKVCLVEDDSVFVCKHRKKVNSVLELSDLKDSGDGSYHTAPWGFSKAELITMLEEGKIHRVSRR